jgi:AmmeMemoRadiSam system protein A/AmmeMemoRadiSam system protein B
MKIEYQPFPSKYESRAMTNRRFLVFSGIAPHPPIMVPEVGRESIASVRASIEAMAELTRRVVEAGAETVVFISPHARLEVDSFVAYEGPRVYADFSHFQAPGIEFSSLVDEELLNAITRSAGAENYRMTMLVDELLDHGTAVPLYFLLRNGWQGRVVALGYSFLSNEDHLRFGASIARAVEQMERRVAFIASGDLSHRLKPEAPAGYNPSAHLFDEEVVHALAANEPERIVDIDPGLRRLAGECGFRSMLVAIGAASELPVSCDVMSYEAPFGVGYLVAQLTNAPADLTPGNPKELPELARRAVETFTLTGEILDPRVSHEGLLAARAPCFVSLKTRDGELRGCIGTIEPAKDTLAQEIVANSISAATSDPRFDPVRESELPDLVYSVDVLMPAEPAAMEDLDPSMYGVIVENEDESRRGLLLPDIPGVDTVHQQVEIAKRKAGISPETPVKLSRFKVERYGERDR